MSLSSKAVNGGLYGTAPYLGVNDQGTMFSVTPSGSFAVSKFCSQTGCANANPASPLVQGTSGSLYGISNSTIFETALDGTATTLYTATGICGPYQGMFEAGLSCAMMQSLNGNFYATITAGGFYGKGTDCNQGVWGDHEDNPRRKRHELI